jgi:hypothetical protein
MRQQQQNSMKAPEQVVNWPFIFCCVASLPLELLLHNIKTFGVRSVGPRAVMAVLLMFIFIAAHPNDDCRPLFWFMILVIPLSIIAQFSAMLRRRRGEPGHTRYSGKPYLLCLFPQLSEGTIKRLEPVVMLMVGGIIHHFNHPLGAFLLTAAVCLGITIGIVHRANCERALDMNDSLIDQQNAAASVRSMQRR